MGAPTLTITHALWALGIASSFVFWPILGKYSQASGPWVSIVMLVSTAVGGISLAYPAMNGQTTPTLRALAMLAVAGFINGAAVYFYATKSVDPGVPTGSFITAVVILMVVVAPVFSYFLNGDTLSIRQWFGLGTALLAIYLLAG